MWYNGAMEFIRARTNEQKQLRLDEIKNAARLLYEKMPFSKITLSLIASQLPFDRANLYKYFSSKEEIYLQILVDEYQRFQLDLAEALKAAKDEDQLCSISSQVVYDYPLMIGLYTIWAESLEPMVPIETAAEATKALFQYSFMVYNSIQQVLRDFSSKEIRHFLWYELRFISGMSNRISGKDHHNEVIRAAGFLPMQIDHRQALTEYLHVVIEGIRARRSTKKDP